ncbi:MULTISPECIES: hypothetical protein [unclassified Flavobacterium]|uniref:hypothetical protein n=1 Tax=unclassified Flavobacterium TaxID=196869 RepID=UPI001F136AC2|nr:MULTISPECIES: hypothetical protein [unclassified Flavobacterium]UMY65149.1 hypothetical protein MKO97_11605 [Flavobacterium sp. HJ-32-4]
MKKFLLFIFCGTAALAQTSTPTPSDTKWHKIGTTTVNFRTESDEIVLTDALPFISLRFKATDASVRIARIELFYDEGDTDKSELNVTLPVKGESDPLPLDGKRKLTRISFVYKTLANAAEVEGHIEVYGMRAAAPSATKQESSVSAPR